MCAALYLLPIMVRGSGAFFYLLPNYPPRYRLGSYDLSRKGRQALALVLKHEGRPLSCDGPRAHFRQLEGCGMYVQCPQSTHTKVFLVGDASVLRVRVALIVVAHEKIKFGKFSYR